MPKQIKKTKPKQGSKPKNQEVDTRTPSGKPLPY